ncbi:MAG: response regulator, partial [Syntrophales bacterium]|nr:response regulator [Syntrophales bacterium]
QQFRAGLDFGLVHLASNPLTKSPEHFDLPGIQASRLESCAQENQILCSETIFRLFGHHYPSMFFGEPIAASAKDRQIAAYVIHPIDFSDVRQYFEDFIFYKLPDCTLPIGERTRILFVDDDHYHWFPEMYGKLLPEFKVEAIADGAAALKKFQPGKYALVVTDEMMPGIRGVELTERLVELDRELPVVMLTCFSSEELAKHFFAAGGTYFLDKIGDIEKTREAIRRSIVTNASGVVRQKLDIVTDDIGGFLFGLQDVAEEFNAILSRARESDDLAYSLLRHKAKQVILTFLDTVLPGNDVAKSLREVRTQLNCVHRLLRAVGSVNMTTLEKHLKEYAGDMMKLSPQIEINVITDSSNAMAPLPYAGLLTMIMCELMDNSLAALKGAGKVGATVSSLPSAQLLRVVVRDSGPGVPLDIRNTMFSAGVSTKGPGRGLGLCLVREAVSGLKGEIRYAYEEGAEFLITVPLRTARPPEG